MELKALITLVVAMFAALTGDGDDKKTEKKVVRHMNFVSAASSGEGQVFIVKHDGDQEHIDVNGSVIDGSEIALGESKSYSTKNGTVTISRDEEGLQIKDEDGKVLRLFGGEEEGAHVMALGGEHFKMVRPNDSVIIQGLDNLDETAREKIRAALADAGVDKEVVFAGTPQMTWVDGEAGEIQVNGSAIFISGDDKDAKDGKTKRVQVFKMKTSSDDSDDESEDKQ